MDPKDRNHPDNEDSRLERDLQALSRANSEVEPSGPPDLLDQAVMNMARRALPGQSKRRPLRWLGAFATATVVVLAFSIVLRQDPQAPADPNGLRFEPAQETESGAPGQTAERRLAPMMDSAPATAPMRKEAPASAAVAEADAAASLSADAEFAEEPEMEGTDPAAEAWITRMLKLHRAQRYEDLKTELAAFRTAFPDYPLPPELAD